MKEVKITVTGGPGTGKSTVASAVAKALKNYGFTVDTNGICQDTPELRETRYDNCKNIVNDVKIIIEEKQTARKILLG